jgi:hypothetical protein
MKIFGAFLLFLTYSSFAMTFRVYGVGGNLLLDAQVQNGVTSVGQISNSSLLQATQQRLLGEYQGSENGVLSINGLGSALEVLSDTEMNAYGWCYRVDGVVPHGLMPDQYKLRGTEKSIEWFYAYAKFIKSDWASMCVPADHFPKQQ